MHKKGYYFSVEALLGILILTTSFLFMLYFSESAVPIPDYRYAQNIAGYLSYVKAGELCSAGCEGLELGNPGFENYSLMEVMGYKYSQSFENATNITREIFAKGDFLLRGKDIAVALRGVSCDIIYSTQAVSCEEGVNETTEAVFRNVIQGYVLNPDSGELSFWGDYIFEVRVW